MLQMVLPNLDVFLIIQKLEPWSVSGVKVAGGINLLSAFAKGLPVPEDHDLIVDVERLKAPLVPKKRLVMLIGVFSTGNNFERRMALRRSWMQYEAVRSGDVAVRFFIGLVSTEFGASCLLIRSFFYSSICCLVLFANVVFMNFLNELRFIGCLQIPIE